MANKTPLEKIQKRIDTCNHKCGCDSKCSPEAQKNCELLKAHAERREHCREIGLPIWYW